MVQGASRMNWRLISGRFGEILSAPIKDRAPHKMRSFILSVSADRYLTAIRNTVLAHAGYAVIPATSVQMAMQMIEQRKVSAMVIGNTISSAERRHLCVEGKKRGIPAVVLD